MLKARNQTDHRQAITWLALEIDERRRRLERLAGHMSDETALERTPSRLSRRATGYRTFCDFLRGIAGERDSSGALEIRGTRNSIDRAYRAVMRSDLADDIKQQIRERYFRLCNQTGLRARPSLPVHRAVSVVGSLIVALVTAALIACGGAETDAVEPAPAKTLGEPMPVPGGTHVEPDPEPAAKPAATAPYSAHETVFFAPGSADLDPRARALLGDEVRWLKENPNRHVVIHGYASDAEGKPTDNLTLSNARANAIRIFLVDSGIAIERVSIVAHGESGPELAPSVERRAVYSAERQPTR